MYRDERYADCTIHVIDDAEENWKEEDTVSKKRSQTTKSCTIPTEEIFRVNKTVLARCSDVLGDLLFLSKPQAHESDSMELEGTGVAFQELLRVAHDLEPEINDVNFVDVFRMAQKYEVYDLLDAVDVWMVKTAVSPFPALRAMDNAIMRVSENEEVLNQMVGACLKTVTMNLDTLIDADALLECSPTTLKVLVLQDYLRCDEEKFLLALIEWGKLNSKEVLQMIAPHLRYGVMSPEFFVDTVVPAGILQPGEVVELLSARTTSRPAKGFPNAHMPRNRRLEHWNDDDLDSNSESTASPHPSPSMSTAGAWGRAIDPRLFIAANSSTTSTPLSTCEGVVVRSALQSARNAFKSSRTCRDPPSIHSSARRSRCDTAAPLRVR
jgi:hypothetical protein